MHKRSADQPPENILHTMFVFHNTIGQFVPHVVWTCRAPSIDFVVEQPLNSIMPTFALLQAALAAAKATRISIPPWKFLAEREKTLQLWGTTSWLQQLVKWQGSLNQAAVR